MYAAAQQNFTGYSERFDLRHLRPQPGKLPQSFLSESNAGQAELTPAQQARKQKLVQRAEADFKGKTSSHLPSLTSWDQLQWVNGLSFTVMRQGLPAITLSCLLKCSAQSCALALESLNDNFKGGNHWSRSPLDGYSVALRCSYQLIRRMKMEHAISMRLIAVTVNLRTTPFSYLVTRVNLIRKLGMADS